MTTGLAVNSLTLNSIYYAMAIIWPQMVAILYTDNGGASMYAGWLACAPSVMIKAGQIFAGFSQSLLARPKYNA
jgi:hypothetical protein